MEIVKFFILLLIFVCSTYIGILISKRYSNRVRELKEIKTALNIFKTKVELTYEPVPEVFLEISKRTSGNVSNIFELASSNMKNMDARTAWISAIDNQQTNLEKEDIEVIKGLGNLLGKVDVNRTSKPNKFNRQFYRKSNRKSRRK